MKQIEVVCAVFVRDGLVFSARKKPHKTQGGLWEFPGGKLEAGETPEAALYREISEELSVVCDINDFIGKNIHAYEHATVSLSAYFAYLQSEDIKLVDHDKGIWLPPWQLFSLQWAQADIELVKLVQKKFGAI